MADLDVALRLRLVNMLSGPAKVAEKDLHKLLRMAGKPVGNKSSDRYAKDLERVSRAAKGATSQVEKLGQSTTRMRDANGRFVAVAASTRKLGQDAAKAARQMELLAQASRKVKPPPAMAVGRVSQRSAQSRSAGKAGGAKAGAAGGIGATEAAVGGAAAARLGGAGLMRMLPGLGAGVGAVASGKNQLDFGRVMFEVEKATDASGEALNKYERTIRSMALETGKTKEEIGQMMAAAGFAGRPVQDLERFTRYASASTLAWGTTAEQTGDSLAQIGNIYKANQQRIEEIGDAINTVADKSASKETDLMEFLRRAGKSANQIGLSAEKTLAFGAAMKEVGVPTEVAGTAFNSLLSKLSTFDEADEDFTKALKAAGVNAKTFKRALVNDAGGALTRLLEGLNKIEDPLKRMAAFRGIGGLEHGDDLMGLAGVVDRLREMFKLMGDKKNYVGSTMQQFAKAQEKDFNKVDRAFRAITEAGNRIMAGPVVALGSLADGVNNFAKATDEGQNEFQKYAAYLEGRYPRLIKMANEYATAAKSALYTGLKTGQLEHNTETADQARLRGQEELRRSEKDTAISERDELRQKNPEALRERARNARRYGSGRSSRTSADRLNSEADAIAPALDHAEEVVRRIHQREAYLVNEATRLEQMAVRPSRNFGFGQGGAKGKGDPLGGGIIGGAGAFGNPAEFRATVKAVAGDMDKLRAMEGWGSGVAQSVTGVQKALEAAAAASGTMEAELSKDLSGAAEKSMGGFNKAMDAQVQRAILSAQNAKTQIEAILNSISASPTIAPRLSLPSAPSAAPASAPAPAGGGRRADAGGRARGNISIAKVEVTGVRDVASLERQLTMAADRRARSSFAGALHDTETA
jgi:TP901 family phage tail tape measure protein